MVRARIVFLMSLLAYIGAAFAYADTAETASKSIFALPAQALRDAPEFREHSGTPAIIILFQPECAWCRIQFKEADAFADSRTDVAIVAVSLKGSRRDLLKELRGAKLNAYRSSPAVLKALLNPKTTPLIYLADKKGVLRYAGRGLHKRDKLEQLAQALTAN